MAATHAAYATKKHRKRMLMVSSPLTILVEDPRPRHPKSREGEGTNPLLLNTHKHVQGCASVVILTFIKLTIRANHDRPQEHRAGGL